MRTFSKRRSEIEAWTLATGSPADGPGNQLAALATRRSKGEQETTVGLSERWRTEGATAGWGPTQAEALLQTRRPHDPATYEQGVWYLADTWFDENGKPQPDERLVHPEDWITDVLRRDLTNTSTTFTRTSAVRAVANRLGTGATMTTIERVTNRLMASNQVIRLNTGNAVVVYTSRELADKERVSVRSLNTLAHLAGPGPGLVDSLIAKRPSLGEDQADAIRALTGTRLAVSVMIGPAGTGKTFTLDIVRQAFEATGWNVIGVAPSARAARELQDGAHISSSTMHSLMARYDNDRLDFGPNTFLIIDEAGMAGIRVLESLTSLVVDAGGRVALIGDHRQLPEIGACGGFEYAAEQAQTVVELCVNRRQKQPWEQQALIALRDGNVADAVQAYVDNNRLHIAENGPGMIRTAVDLWFQGIDGGLDVVLQAGTNKLVDRLNATVLDRLAAPGGALEGQVLVDFGGTGFFVGQRAVTRKNFVDPANREVRVINGQPGTVTAIDEHAVTIHFDGNEQLVTLGANYLAAGGRLSHGYVYTTHRTQGGTWDASIAVGLYREGAYTALSRGRVSNVLVLTDPEQQQLQAERDNPVQRHDTGIRLPTEEPNGVEGELLSRAGRRRGKQLAHTLDPMFAAIDELGQTYDYPELLSLAATTMQRERVAFGQTRATPVALSERLERQQRLAEHLAPGARVKALDRGNIGVVARINEKDATATIRFRSIDGRRAAQTMRWDGLAIVDQDTATSDVVPDEGLASGPH